MVNITGDGTNETLTGSTDADQITGGGGGGDDTIDGLAGDDVIDGGVADGESLPSGSSDDDLIFGRAGNDSLSGDTGDDQIFGGEDNDTIEGDDLTFDNTNVVCFVAGTLIATSEGAVPIEDLSAGDRILTMDNGYQEIRWVGSTKVAAVGKLAPIRIKAGAMRNDRDLLVSPQHRMLLSGWQAEILFGDAETLVAAKMLINDTSITRVEGGEVEYFHILFDQHEIIFSEGCPSESFHPGQQGWGALAEEARAEILEIFPKLSPDSHFGDYGAAARRSLSNTRQMRYSPAVRLSYPRRVSVRRGGFSTQPAHPFHEQV